MRHLSREVVLAIVLLSLSGGAAPAAAQAAVSSFADLQGRLKADQTVYVETAVVVDEHRGGVKGEVLDLSGSTLRLLVNGQRREFSERDVLVVSERHTGAGTGAVVGLSVGGVLGLGFDRWLVNSIGSDRRFRSDDLVVTGLFAGLGAWIGASIGRAHERERVLFLAPDLKKSHTFTITPFVGSGRKGLAAAFRF
jgi:hypothetical protein